MAVKLKSGGSPEANIKHLNQQNFARDDKNNLLVGARVRNDGTCYVWFSEIGAGEKGGNLSTPEMVLTRQNSPITHEYKGVTASATLDDEPIVRAITGWVN
ncbi:hypothetical protein KBC75_03195 [Candidatus Shapirobacteria bacterium]|nr:hypothetical protein [Candidatus Shapirobacteria bacterium]